jgi:hypothetical protein
MIGTVKAAQNSLSPGGGALTLEIELLENLEARLDLRQIALRVGHLLLDALTLEFPSLYFGFGTVERRLGGMHSLGGRGNLSGRFLEAFARGRLGFEHLASFVLE